jgi:hypothetical protein
MRSRQTMKVQIDILFNNGKEESYNIGEVTPEQVKEIHQAVGVSMKDGVDAIITLPVNNVFNAIRLTDVSRFTIQEIEGGQQ